MLYNFVKGPQWMLMAPILILSVLSVALILERLYYWLRYSLRKNRHLRLELLHLDFDSHKVLRTKDPVARTFYELIRNPVDPALALDHAERTLRESKRNLSILNLIATISTSFGLLGTVVGVALSFKSLALNNAAQLAVGLSIALYTTIGGLIVFLISYIFSTVFLLFSSRLGYEMEEGLNQLKVKLDKRIRQKRKQSMRAG
jgi:biopolymer transport protein ExbB